MSGKTYKIVEGAGFVPGLPAEISAAQAKELGVEDLLKECIAAKLYKEVAKKDKKEGEA